MLSIDIPICRTYTDIVTHLPSSYISCLNPTARPVLCIMSASDIIRDLCHDVRCLLRACWHCCSQTQYSKNAPETFWNVVRWPLQSRERSELARGPTRISLLRALVHSCSLSLTLIESWDYARPVIVVLLASLSWLLWREGEREMCSKCVCCFYKNAITTALLNRIGFLFVSLYCRCTAVVVGTSAASQNWGLSDPWPLAQAHALAQTMTRSPWWPPWLPTETERGSLWSSKAWTQRPAWSCSRTTGLR